MLESFAQNFWRRFIFQEWTEFRQSCGSFKTISCVFRMWQYFIAFCAISVRKVTNAYRNERSFLKSIFIFLLFTSVRTLPILAMCIVADVERSTTLCKYTIANHYSNADSMKSIVFWKVRTAFSSIKERRVIRYSPWCIVNAVVWRSNSSFLTFQELPFCGM